MSFNKKSNFRILYIMTDPFRLGGVPSALKVLGPHFVKNGHEVFIASPDGDQVRNLVGSGVIHIPFSVHFKTFKEFKGMASELRNLISKIKPTVLSPQSIRSSMVCYASSKDMPLPRIATVHNIHTPLTSFVAGKLLNKCAHFVVFESDHEHQRLVKKGLSFKKSCVIPGGVDTLRFQKKGKPEYLLNGINKLSSESIIFGCIARLSEQKAHNDLLKAFSIVVGKIPSSRLVLVGDGPLKQDLIWLTQKLNLTPYVHFAGQQENIPDYLNLLDVFVLASSMSRESLPWAIREAMGCGLPVIATQIGANKELVRQGVNGFLVPPKNPVELAKIMIILAEDKILRDQMGKESLSLVKKNQLTQDVWLEKNEKLYLFANEQFGERPEKISSSFLGTKELIFSP